MKRFMAALLAVVMVMAVTACGSDESSKPADENGAGEAAYPMTVTDYLGNEMEFAEAPQKIVSLSPSCTEILYALGQGDKMVGVSTWCTYPEEAAEVEQVGDTYSVSVERIIELDADVVFVSGGTAAESVDALNAAGINVYSTGAKNVDEIYESIENIGAIVDASDKANEVVTGMKNQLADLEELVPQRLQVDRVVGFGLHFHEVPLLRGLDNHGRRTVASNNISSPLSGKEHPGQIKHNTLVFEQILVLEREAVHRSQRRHVQTALDFDLATFGIEPSEGVKEALDEHNVALPDEQKGGVGPHCQV